MRAKQESALRAFFIPYLFYASSIGGNGGPALFLEAGGTFLCLFGIVLVSKRFLSLKNPES